MMSCDSYELAPASVDLSAGTKICALPTLKAYRVMENFISLEKSSPDASLSLSVCAFKAVADDSNAPVATNAQRRIRSPITIPPLSLQEEPPAYTAENDTRVGDKKQPQPLS